ncbi:TPA: LacI family DNA-binding transcriptional regulator, partial [Klebsiella pneumoniae]
MRKATMRDVSEATGFSMFTVSRALNGGDGVADDSRELILKVARELGYVPNRAAQALRRSSRDSVAVITAHASNSYYLNLMSG